MVSPLCRICGTTFNLMHIWQGGAELLEKLRVCANIKIDFEGELPKHLCRKCEQGLNFSYHLRKQGEAMEFKLRQQSQQCSNAVDLSNEVDDIEEELQEFRVHIAKKIDSVPNEPLANNSIDENTTPELIKTLQNVEAVKSDEVPILKENVVASEEFNAGPLTLMGDNITQLTNTIIDHKTQARAIVVDGEVIENIVGNSYSAIVEQDDDDVEIIEEFHPWNGDKIVSNINVEVPQQYTEDASKINSSNNLKMLQPYIDTAIHYTGNSSAIMEPQQVRNNYMDTNMSIEPLLQEQFSGDNEQDVEIIENYDRITQTDTLIGAPVNDLIEEQEEEVGDQNEPCVGDYAAVNYENQIILEENIEYETMEKYSIDLVDKVEVASEDDNEHEDDIEVDEMPESNPMREQKNFKVTLDYKCETCGENFATQMEYRKHIKVHGNERFSCIQCNKWFSARYRLAQHERIHTDDTDIYVCSICGNRYRHPQNLKRHMRTAHNTDNYNPNQCGICNEVFTRSDVLKNHMTKHIEERNFKCELCFKSFKSMFYLLAHKRSHLPKTSNIKNKPTSTTCTPSYTSTSTDSSSSPQHSVSAQRTYNCSYCGKISKHHFAHKNHLRTHTQERPYACEFCAKKFRTLAAKITHERIHNDVRPYQCEHCLRSFRQPSHLKEHMLIHGSVMPFNCSICNISFLKKSNLKVHTRIHTGERPYKCAESECGLQFAQLSQLKRHAAKAHARDVEVLEGDDDENEEISDEDQVDNNTTVDMYNKEEHLNLDVGIGAEETAMDFLIGNNTPYNSFYILDD